MGRKRRGDALEEKKEGPTSLFILRESNVLRRVTKGGIYIGCLLSIFGPPLPLTCQYKMSLPLVRFWAPPLSVQTSYVHAPPISS